MKQHGIRMDRIRGLLAEVDAQHREMVELADRIDRLRDQIQRELRPVVKTDKKKRDR
jgi:polyhydroxyalkanoate synthesis regulator phasin